MFTNQPETITVTAPAGPLGIALARTVPSVVSELDPGSPCESVPPGDYYLASINGNDTGAMRHAEVVGLVQEFSAQERTLVFKLLSGKFMPVKDSAEAPATPQDLKTIENHILREAYEAQAYAATADAKPSASTDQAAGDINAASIYPDPNSKPVATMVIPPAEAQPDASVQGSATTASTTSPPSAAVPVATATTVDEPTPPAKAEKKGGWANRFMNSAAAATASVITTASNLDKKYKITEQANKAADSAAKQVDSLDKKYKVTESIDKQAQAITRSINSFDAKVKAKVAESGSTKA